MADSLALRLATIGPVSGCFGQATGGVGRGGGSGLGGEWVGLCACCTIMVRIELFSNCQLLFCTLRLFIFQYISTRSSNAKIVKKTLP